MQYFLLNRVNPDEFAVYPLIATLLFFLPLIMGAFESPCSRYVILAYAKNDRKRITEIVSTVMPVLAAVSMLVFFLGLIAAYYIDSIFVIAPPFVADAQLMTAMLVVSALLSLILTPYSVAFSTMQRMVLSNAIYLGGELLKLAILIVLLIGVGPRVLWVVVAHFIATVTVTIIRAVVSRRMIRELRFSRSSVRWDMVGELTGFGSYTLGLQISRFLRSAIPIWILNGLGNPVGVTSYHLGQTAYRQAMQIWYPVRNNIGPPLIAMHAKGEHARLRQAYYRGGRIALWLIMIIATPLIVFHEQIISLYASDTYLLAGGVMVLLLLRLPVELMNGVLPQIARAKGDIKRLSTVMLASESIIGVVMLSAVWILGHGAITAAFCALIGSLLTELFLIWPIAMRLVEGKRRDSIHKTFLPGLTPAVGAGIVWYGFMLFLDPQTWAQLSLALMPGWAAYIGFGMLCLLPEDRRDLGSMLSRIRTRLTHTSS